MIARNNPIIGKNFEKILNEQFKRENLNEKNIINGNSFLNGDVVSVIAAASRERFKLRECLAALTSQGKATAMFIGCLPYGITLITYCATPGYIIPFLNNPIARIVLIMLIIWEGLGFWILMKMTTFEV